MDKAHMTHEGNVVFVSHVLQPVHVMTNTLPQGWMSELNSPRRTQPSVDANQLTSISAMISYISRHSGQSEFRIERRLSDRFNIPNAKCLAANDFDEAIRYLADIISA